MIVNCVIIIIVINAYGSHVVEWNENFYNSVWGTCVFLLFLTESRLCATLRFASKVACAGWRTCSLNSRIPLATMDKYQHLSTSWNVKRTTMGNCERAALNWHGDLKKHFTRLRRDQNLHMKRYFILKYVQLCSNLILPRTVRSFDLIFITASVQSLLFLSQ